MEHDLEYDGAEEQIDIGYNRTISYVCMNFSKNKGTISKCYKRKMK